MTAHAQMLDILRNAYQIEVNGFTFYTMTAEKAAKPAVKELFQKLADDEVQHQNYLKGIGKRFDKEGAGAFAVNLAPPDFGAISGKVFTDHFKQQARGAAFEMGVLSVGLTLETNAIALFNQAAKTADSKEIKEFYRFLAEWEKQHFDLLSGLYDALRTDFWGEGGFSPF